MVKGFLKYLFKKKYQDSEIEKCVMIGNYKIILLKDKTKVAIIGLDADNNILWKIKNKNYFDHKGCKFTNIYVEENQLCIYNTAGVELTVNPENGEITNEELIK